MSKETAKTNGDAASNPALNAEALRKIEAAIAENAATSRSELFSMLMNPRRDIYRECGYPEWNRIPPDDYKMFYDREAIARRAVKVLPEETWKSSPEIYEDEDEENETAFEKRWKEVSQNLRGTSNYADAEGNPVWEHLKRADTLSGIGHYGILLLGLSDGEPDLSQPVKGLNERGEREGKPADLDLIYLKCFDEVLALVTQWEKDPTNPRYAMPNMYRVILNDYKTEAAISGIGLQVANQEVHWTRVIHIADNLDSSECVGAPRLQGIYNRVYDLMKLYSGSAEMYWQGAFPGISLETHPQLGGDVQFPTNMNESLDRYKNKLSRFLAIAGISVKSLAPQVVDPTKHIETQIECICIEKGIPKRIFMGSERGELASSQDDSTWNDVCRARQNGYVTPKIIVPFIDRLIAVGVLPEPKDGFHVQWPALDALTDQEKATVALTKTQAIGAYVSGGCEQMIEPTDYWTRIMGMDKEEAEEIVDAVMEAAPPTTDDNHPVYEDSYQQKQQNENDQTAFENEQESNQQLQQQPYDYLSKQGKPATPLKDKSTF